MKFAPDSRGGAGESSYWPWRIVFVAGVVGFALGFSGGADVRDLSRRRDSGNPGHRPEPPIVRQ